VENQLSSGCESSTASPFVFLLFFLVLSPDCISFRLVNDAKHKIQGIGDKRIVQKIEGDQQEQQQLTPQLEIVGAGGWGGGVNLATSDQKTQDINRINLERFRKKLLRDKQKREREAGRQNDNKNDT
jgi:hypothetical protein